VVHRTGSTGGWQRRFGVAVAVVFLFTPLALIVTGQRAKAFENHRLARFPSVHKGWAWFTDLPGWATDQLPLREQAVRADARINAEVFGDSPVPNRNPVTGPGPGIGPGSGPSRGTAPSAALGGYPSVVVGTHGYWFYGGDEFLMCTPVFSAAQVAQRLNRLATMIEASGRKFVAVAPPDKTDFASAYLPPDFRGKQCYQDRARATWRALRAVPSFVDLRPALRAAQPRDPYPMYLPRDTHWNGAGSAVFVRALVERLQADVARSFVPRTLPGVTGPADLGIVAGTADRSTRHTVLLASPRVRVQGRLRALTVVPFTTHASGPPGTLVTIPTLVIGDSFALMAELCMTGVFADLTEIYELSARDAAGTLISEIVKSRAVVLEVVERVLFSGQSGTLFDSFLARLSVALVAHPVR
jgi:acetyltransferase AlgX (SGNH hydrolase-like protein)